MFCEPQYKPYYDSLLEAREKCTQDSDCEMFFDFGRRGKIFVICGPKAKEESGITGSILYVKGKVKYFQAMVLSKDRLTIGSESK